jgi:hypothetical protein
MNEALIVLAVLLLAVGLGYIAKRVLGDEKSVEEDVIIDPPEEEYPPSPTFPDYIDERDPSVPELTFDDVDLTEVKGIGPKTQQDFWAAFDSPEDILDASHEELEKYTSRARAERLLEYLELKKQQQI